MTIGKPKCGAVTRGWESLPCVRDVHGSGLHLDAAGGTWGVPGGVERVDEHDVPKPKTWSCIYCGDRCEPGCDCGCGTHQGKDILVTTDFATGKLVRAEVPAPKPIDQPAIADAGENPKQRFGAQKVPVHLVPPAAIIGMAKALGEGAEKYQPFNWRSAKVRRMTYIGAAIRHLLADLDGEDVDPESTYGKTHIEGALGSLAVLQDAIAGGFLVDDRPPKGPAPEMLRAPGFKR